MKALEFPNRITIELTNQCNVSCIFCPRQTVPMEIGYMDVELYKKLIDEAAEHLPVKLVIFFRGESLIHPDFVECVDYAKKKGIGPIQYASNAYALDEDIADKLLETGIDFISFSLDTIDPDVYRKSRLQGDLKTSMEHVISLCKKCKQRKAENKPVPTIQVSTIEIPEYMERQQEFIEFWKEYVDVVRVYYEHDDKGKFRNPDVEKKLEEEIKNRMPCRKVFTDLLVYWNGELALCNYDWNGGIKGMNVRDMSIEEIWHSEQYNRIREMHNQGNFDEDIMCKDCEHWKIDYTQSGFLGKMYKGNGINDKG